MPAHPLLAPPLPVSLLSDRLPPPSSLLGCQDPTTALSAFRADDSLARPVMSSCQASPTSNRRASESRSRCSLSGSPLSGTLTCRRILSAVFARRTQRSRVVCTAHSRGAATHPTRPVPACGSGATSLAPPQACPADPPRAGVHQRDLRTCTLCCGADSRRAACELAERGWNRSPA